MLRNEFDLTVDLIHTRVEMLTGHWCRIYTAFLRES